MATSSVRSQRRDSDRGRPPAAPAHRSGDRALDVRSADVPSPTQVRIAGPRQIIELQRLAGNRAVTSLLRQRKEAQPGGPAVTVSRLTTSVASLGETGLIGQAKALVGMSTYVKIKEALGRYYQAKLPLDRQKQLVSITTLIAQWMRANRSSTTKGNLSRMGKLQRLDGEVRGELAALATAKAPAMAAPTTATTPSATVSTRDESMIEDESRGPEPTVAQPPSPTNVAAPTGESVAEDESVVDHEARGMAPANIPTTANAPTGATTPTAPGNGLVADVPRVKALNQTLRSLIAESKGTSQVARKVDLTRQIQAVIAELLPMLTDPQLAKIHRAISDYDRTLREALPAMEEQAEYLRDVIARGDKLAFLSGTGAMAAQQAITLAQGIVGGQAGTGVEALKIMQEGGITDAEMAAIKIYTAADYRYINAGMARDRGGWLRDAIVKLDDRPATAPETLGAPLGKGEQGPLSKGDAIAASEGARHGRMALAGLRKMKPWAGGQKTFRGMALSHEEFRDQFENANTWTSSSFTSTSVDKSVSVDFVKRESQSGKQGFFMIFEEVIDGRDLKDVSIFGKEGEVLLLPGAVAEILFIEDDPTEPTVKLVHLRQTK